MKKKCPECGGDVVGRMDKMYCSDACRNAHHNHRNKKYKNMIRNINNRLRKNYMILEELNPEHKIKIDGYKLISKGFDFDHFTSIYTTKTGNVYYFIYNQGYLPLKDEYYALVKRAI